MKRTHIFIGLVAFALLVFASITATLAAPGNIPFLQSTSETEPNNSFDEADEVGMPDPGYIIGEVYNTPVTETLDYFVMDTTVGYKYQANLTIDSPQGLNLKMVLWNGNRQCMDTSSSSSSSTSLSWTASYTSHYIRVEAVTISTSTLKTANYRLDVFERAEPTDTPEPTNTLSPNPWDEYEPNDSLGEPSDDASIGATLENLNFWPYEAYTEEEANAIEDVDVFRVWCKPGHTCRAKAAVTTGVDTMVKVYADDATDPSEPTIVENDDYGETLGSQVTWQSSASGDGYYKIWIENLDRSPRQSTGQTYNLTLIDLVATPTPTPTPGPSPTPGPGINPKSDSCEDNLDFAHACVIPANQSQTFNFVPPYGGVDNDYFKIWVKPGL
ncbi:MAG: hypothetical protein ISS49_03650, partial [Anaerolineae bacterium]|nr:hypothetical protein [Anaerolineae bacterium]